MIDELRTITKLVNVSVVDSVGEGWSLDVSALYIDGVSNDSFVSRVLSLLNWNKYIYNLVVGGYDQVWFC